MKKIVIFSILALSLSAASSMAAITLENSGAAGELITVNGTSTSLTLAGFDAGTAADTYVIVAIATKLKTDTANPVSSVTFGGTPLTKLAEEHVDDGGNYQGWAILYGGALSGTGDVVVNYTAPTDDLYDAVSFSAASYSDVSGTDAVGIGNLNTGDPGTLSDSITTTNDNSLIISSIMVGADDVAGFTGVGSTVVVQESNTERSDNALLSLAAPTAGVYAPGASWTSSQSREAIISVELTEQAAPKATTFIVR